MNEFKNSDQMLIWFNKYLKTITWCFGAAIIGVILLYIIVLCGNPISSNPENLGQLGDYFGGLLNPIIAIGNLIFLVYLTLVIKHRDDNADVKAIETQKNLALIQFRQEALNKMQSQLANFIDLNDTFQMTINNHVETQMFLHSFHNNYEYLFDTIEFHQLFEDLDSKLNEILIYLSDYKKEKESPINFFLLDYTKHAAIFDMQRDFGNLRSKLSIIMQHVILDKPYTEPALN